MPSSGPVISFVIAGLFFVQSTEAQTQPNGTTVYRCIDLNGVVRFADAPCKKSVSHRLRIEHSLIQSVPISVEEQQRLYALDDRLNRARGDTKRKSLASKKRRLAQSAIAEERCKQARQGLVQIRLRKRRGYPVSQSQRIDNEEIALRGEIDLYCNASTDACLLYTSPSPRDQRGSRMPSSA